MRQLFALFVLVTVNVSANAGAAPPPPALPSASTGWSQDAGNAQRTGYTTEDPLTPWTYLWSWNGPDANGGVGGHTYDAPREARTVMGGGNIYVPAGSQGLYALNVANGTQTWRVTAATFNATPAYDSSGYVYAGGSNGTLYKIAAGTGAVAGTYTSGSGLNKAVLLAGNFAYAVSDDGRLHKVDGGTMAAVWVYGSGSTTATPPSYSASRDVIIFATADLFVQAVNNSNGTPKWRVKPTPNTPGGSTLLTLGGTPQGNQFDNGWPVVADQNGIVFVRLQLDPSAMIAYPSANNIFPNVLATIRTWLQNNPQNKNVFALNLDTGAEQFIPAVGYGSTEDMIAGSANGFGVMGSQPVVKVNSDGSEVAYIHFRNGQSSPPDFRWDAHMGEMALNDSTIPGLVAGDLRFVRMSRLNGYGGNSYVYLTDEQTPITVAGNTIFNAHWAASTAVRIADRSPTLGLTYANPIQTTNLQPFIRALQNNCADHNNATHFTSCTNLNYVTDGGRFFDGPGFWGYWGVPDPPGWRIGSGNTAGTSYSAGDLPRYTYVSNGYIVIEGNGGDISVLKSSGSSTPPQPPTNLKIS